MIKRTLIIISSIIFLIIFALMGALFVIFRGPSESVRDKVTLSLLETSAAYFVPKIFLPAAAVEKIVEANGVVDSAESTDTSLVKIPNIGGAGIDGEGDDGGGEGSPDQPDEWAEHPDGIRIEYIKGDTYRGYVMLIRDPARVFTATSSDFKNGKPGMRIMDVYDREGAVAAINGGGFPDDGGNGSGSVPQGLVFSKGEKLWGDENTVYDSVVGFDSNNILLVGSMSAKAAREKGMRDCVAFGPILVVNGEPAQVKGVNGSLNPRTAIGQRADGAVIFICIDGRMPSSMGASISELINVMLEFGAVNAANLDGGSSTNMIYNGDVINISSSLKGARTMPTFFMVKPNEL